MLDIVSKVSIDGNIELLIYCIERVLPYWNPRIFMPMSFCVLNEKCRFDVVLYYIHTSIKSKNGTRTYRESKSFDFESDIRNHIDFYFSFIDIVLISIFRSISITIEVYQTEKRHNIEITSILTSLFDIISTLIIRVSTSCRTRFDMHHYRSIHVPGIHGGIATSSSFALSFLLLICDCCTDSCTMIFSCTRYISYAYRRSWLGGSTLLPRGGERERDRETQSRG